MARELKIALVDDHALFRNGLRRLIDGQHGCRVVAEAGDGTEFLENAEAVEADTVPMRGNENEPSFLPHTLKVLAELRNISPEALAILTTDNAKRILKC